MYSTLNSCLTDFQLTYARREWSEERSSWRSVVQLNFVRNVNLILDHLNQEMTGTYYNENDDDFLDDPAPPRKAPKTLPPLRFTEKHRTLAGRLARLANVQFELEQKLGAASTEILATSVTTAAPFPSEGSTTSLNRRALQEFSINSSNGWKSALDKFRAPKASVRERSEENDADVLRRAQHVDKDVSEVIASCKDDIKDLSEDDLIQEMLTRRKVRMEDLPGL